MTSRPSDDAATAPIRFDPFDYAFQADPYPVYARMRAEDPLHYSEVRDVWALTRHADIAAAVRSEGTYSNAMGVSLEPSAFTEDAHRAPSASTSASERRRSRNRTARERVASQPADVASSVVFLASKESSFATGAELVVDGATVPTVAVRG